MINMNRKKLIIIIIILITSIFIFTLYNNKSNKTTNQIKKILKETGFKLDNGEYTKQTSVLSEEEYYKLSDKLKNAYTEKMYFDINNYILKKSSMDYYNNLASILNANFLYKEGCIEYNYELNYNKSNKTFIFEGEYIMSGDSFECELINSQNYYLTNEEKEVICSNIEKEIDKFRRQAESLFEDTKLEQKMLYLY